jgi:DNA transposition AAA+ family ATPase
MATTNNERTFTEDETAEIREQVRQIMESEGLNQKVIAREADVAYGTFTGWLAGTYQGNNDKYTAAMQIWLSSREENKRSALTMPEAPGFVATPSTSAFIEMLRYAQISPEITVISGAAAIGKTTAAHRYQATNRNVWIATMDPTTAKVNGMLLELCDVMNVLERAPAKLARAIGRKIEGTGGLLIIDEAQFLEVKSLEMLRSLYDRHGVGVALMGNEDVYSRLTGDGKRSTFAQLFSRIGMRITLSGPKPADMCRLIEAWGVTNKEEIRLLKSIASRPGALRSMTKVLKLASMLAAGAGEPRSAAHMKAAYAQISTNAAA